MDRTEDFGHIYDMDFERLDEINEDLKIIQRKNGLTFGTDAYLLAAFAKSFPNGKALDIGCGCGVIALLCAQRKKYSSIYAVEIQQVYAELALRNVKMNSLEGQISVINKDVRELKLCDIGGEADVVIMNPPYMKTGCGRNNTDGEMNAARREVNGTIFDMCLSGAKLLKYGGLMYIVYRTDRLIDLVDSMRKASVEPKRMIMIYADIYSEPGLVLIEGKKGASPALSVSRPLIIYESEMREYTKDMKKIYSEFSLSHMFVK